MARASMRLEGADEMDAKLGGLDDVAERDFLERLAVDTLEPVAVTARGIVRRRSGTLADSIGASTTLGPSQSGDAIRDDGAVAAYVGPGSLVQAITEEFGTVDEVGHPYLRPGWDENVGGMQAHLRQQLGRKMVDSTKG